MRGSRIGWLCAIVLAGAPGSAVADEPEAARLDVLLVADTGDPEIGAGARIDLANMRRAIEKGVPEGKRKVTVLAGAEAAPERILAHYRRMPASRETALFLYYAGRGGWTDAGHALRMNAGSLERRRLLETMRSKDAPLVVALTECSSLYVEGSGSPERRSPDPERLRDLLFRHRGVVDVTAAGQGEEGVGDRVRGGLFTHALVEELTTAPRDAREERRDRVVTWKEVTAAVIEATAASFRRDHPRGVEIGGRRISEQRPHAFDVGTAPRTPIRRPRWWGVDVVARGQTVVVERVASDTPAAWVEFRPGDRLVSIRVPAGDGEERTFALERPADVDRALAELGEPTLVAVTVVPAGGSQPAERWVRLGPVPLETVDVPDVPPSLPPDVPPTRADAKAPDTKTVFYATDRARFRPDLAWYALRFAWFLGALVLGWLVLRWIRKTHPRPWLWLGLRIAYVAVVGALFALAAFEAIHMKQVADRLDVLYGGDRREEGGPGPDYDVGTAEVSFPPNHRRGELERPSPWRGDFFEDPDVHMVVFDVAPMEEGRFFSKVGEAVAASAEADAFVFVHGYNTTFEDAVLRTAQIAYDLDFRGAPILFSWPSQGRYLGYPVDETNVDWATSHLARFLRDLKARSGARRIHLIAHSMGNRALAGALEKIRVGPPPEIKFNQVVLAAPDIDAAIFRRDIATPIQGAASRVTLYASSHDAALSASKRFHGYARAGDTGESVVVVDGMDTIDVSGVTTTHSYIGDNGWVLDDLGLLLLSEKPIADRPRLRFFERLKHWILEAAR
jgi:esterase/lipase superfamily enzyme